MSKLLAPFAWLFGFHKNAVIVHSYTSFIFTWPLIVLGYLFWPLLGHGMISPVTAGWIYIITAVIVLLTMGIDINRNVTIFWIVLVFAVFFGLKLAEDRGIHLLSRIGLAMGHLQPTFSAHFGLSLSVLLTAFYAIVIGSAWLNDRWRFVAGEIEHYSFGRSDDSMGRGAKVISTSYPDVLELVLMLAGTITIYNAQKTLVLAKINRVPLLPFRVKKINRLLESVQVTPSQSADEETAHAEVAESDRAENESGTMQS